MAYAPIVIPDWTPPKELGGNRRMRGFPLHELQRSTRTTVQFVVQASDWTPHANQRRRVVITTWRPRRLDTDNEYAACKYAVDGLKVAGVIRNDSVRWLDLVVKQEIGPSRTRLELEDLGSDRA